MGNKMSIKKVQTKLVKLGFGNLLGKNGIDGINGKDTTKSVRMFQLEYNKKFGKNILVDGIAGKQVNKSLDIWLRNLGTKGSRNFNINEFRCKGTGKLIKMDNKLIYKLEELRYYFNKPIIINSGYRTPQHNRNVGGAKNSQHLYGRAADVVVKGVNPSKVYNYAVKHFDGVGKYNTFTHVDTRGYKARF